MTRLIVLVLSTLGLLAGFLALVLGMVLLGWGCTGPTYSYSKAGSDVADFNRDSYTCGQESGSYAGGSGLADAAAIIAAKPQANYLYKRCMEARGWTAEVAQ